MYLTTIWFLLAIGGFFLILYQFSYRDPDKIGYGAISGAFFLILGFGILLSGVYVPSGEAMDISTNQTVSNQTTTTISHSVSLINYEELNNTGFNVLGFLVILIAFFIFGKTFVQFSEFKME